MVRFNSVSFRLSLYLEFGAIGTLLAFVYRVHVPFQAEFLAVLRSIRFRPWLLRCYQHHYIYKHVFVAAYALPCLLREERF